MNLFSQVALKQYFFCDNFFSFKISLFLQISLRRRMSVLQQKSGVWVSFLKVGIQIQFCNKKYFVMNMAEKAEDLDYEPDVLKFKQIWEEMKETSKEDKPKAKNKEPQMPAASISKSKKQGADRNKEQSKQTKKQTILSEKNVVRNPKADHQKVIDVMTRPLGSQPDSFKNHKDFVKRDQYVQNSNAPTLQSEVNSLKRAVDEKDYQLSLLRVSQTRNEDRIRFLESEILKKDQRISELQARQREIISHNNLLSGNQKVFDYGQVEYQNYRNDSRRLLKMLQTTDEYQQFANLALDDNGIRFLNSVNKNVKSFLDTKEKTRLHFCTCNKDFIPESGFWVPEKVYSYSKQFVTERKGEVTNAELELLLYDLNRMWREREKRIINTLNSQKAKEVEKLKRKIAQHKHGAASQKQGVGRE